MFTAAPSSNVTVSEFTISLPAGNVSDTYLTNTTTVFQAATVYTLEEYTGVASGQQWTFEFKGKLGSAQGQDFDVTSNYAVP